MAILSSGNDFGNAAEIFTLVEWLKGLCNPYFGVLL
jgi:hypothetical protein